MSKKAYNLTDMTITFETKDKGDIRVGGINSLSCEVAWDNKLIGEAGSKKNVAHNKGVMSVSGSCDISSLDLEPVKHLLDLDEGDNPEFNLMGVVSKNGRPVRISIKSAVFKNYTWSVGLADEAKSSMPFDALDFRETE